MTTQPIGEAATLAQRLAELEAELRATARELSEARAREIATGEILKLIAASPGDASPVFDAIADNANRLVGGFSCAVWRIEGDFAHLQAYTSTSSEGDAALRALSPRPLSEFHAAVSVIFRGEIGQLVDTEHASEAVRIVARQRGYRAMLFVPLMLKGTTIGYISISRRTPGAFAPHHVQLLQAFADQATIAIQNARLFDETREALERQTATAEILRVISQSPTDAKPVFERIVLTAARLLHCDLAFVMLVEGKTWRNAALATPEGLGTVVLTEKFPVDPHANFPSRAIVNKAMVHFPDWSAIDLPDHQRRVQSLYAINASLHLPFLRAGECVGVLTLLSQRAYSFGPMEIAQAGAFRDQALIAIENARLFNETKEALQQQTATADVLKVISRSAFDLQAVFDALLSSAVELVGGVGGGIALREGDELRFRAQSSPGGILPADFVGRLIPIDRSSAAGRAVGSGRIEYIPDGDVDPEFRRVGSAEFGQSYLGVPLARDGRVEGALTIISARRHAFTQRHIELAQTFADQAVIAIENTRLFDEVQARTRDLTEALQMQTATSDVLKVISRSAFGLKTVLQALVDSAVRLFASDGVIYLRHGDEFRAEAVFGAATPGQDSKNRSPRRAGRDSVTGRVALSGKVEQIPDNLADPDFKVVGAQRMQMRSLLGVPLLRDGKVEGVFLLGRPEPGPFSERAIELVQTFADQAVIAIENVRLFEQVQARTRDLTEALQQQRAASDILQVISGSVSDATPVFEKIVETCHRLFEGMMNTVFLVDGSENLTVGAIAGPDPERTERFRREFPVPFAGTGSELAFRARSVLAIADVWNDPRTPEGLRQRCKQLGQNYSVAIAPMIWGGKAVGSVQVARSDLKPFEPGETRLLQTFADQAVIAIQNARLIDEVQERTRELSEALQQQTATTEVLKVISRSAFDLQAVLDILVTSAAKLIGADSGNICVRVGDSFRYKAFTFAETDRSFAEYLRAHPVVLGRGSIAGRTVISGKVEQIPDIRADDEYRAPLSEFAFPLRALVGVPLHGKDRLEGVFIVTRLEPGPFSERQIEILQTFADQAVIAIENTRLFEEVQARTRELSEALQMQTATSDVLKVISSSAFNLQPVFDAMAENAVRLCEAERAVIFQFDGHLLRAVATHNVGPALRQFLDANPIAPGRKSISARAALYRRTVQVADAQSDSEYSYAARDVDLIRTIAAIPMLKGDQLIGTITIYKLEATPFSDEQIKLVETFAEQAVIAVENVRLFDELQARTRELEQSLDDLRKAQDRLVQSEKLASLGQLTAGIAHEIKNPLNFVNNFSQLSRELLDELRALFAKPELAEDERKEGDELIGMIGSNLDKVVTHGKRADSIVKNMLLHSREGSGERSKVNVNALVEEALNLAYHGVRAEKPDFNVTIEKSLDARAGVADLYAQEMTRVLLNLISNGFYATTKRKQGDPAHEPIISASTRDLGDHVEICVSDNGTGIPDEVKAKMFNPFFTTKPAGEGTGLGLSLSHDIVVKQHGGTIDFASEPGAYTQFIIRLPRAGAAK